jgi:NAD(P)-dependent dehydrogenase (short-subunit alcohol dehydrogenase family)
MIQRLASMAKLGHIDEPEYILRVVLFWVSDAAGWVAGQSLGVNGEFA